MNAEHESNRLGLLGATSVGVGAIVGGGILALAGTAFAATGPAAILAFLLNGIIALMTALSFAEMASRFPESGGTYTFSKKVLSVDAAFSVGWVVCFASVVAAVLYALGFAHFLILGVSQLFPALQLQSQGWLTPALAIFAALVSGLLLSLKPTDGGRWINVAKIVVFMILVLAGLWAVSQQKSGDTAAALKPFFSNGFAGLVQAMGYTFIALQGFDLIAAIGGDVKQPAKNIPSAMILSLVIALTIYLPLLLVISTVGTADGIAIDVAAQQNPEGLVAEAAKNYLGAFGYWLVIIASILAMYSALQANLYAASKIMFTMARDRTLPTILSHESASSIPRFAVACSTIMIVLLVLLIPDVGTAGAASSLIFLVTFALAHGIAILVRRRTTSRPPPFRTPWFPAIPIVGGLACLSLAVFQGLAVPSAGVIAAVWLALGTILFVSLFAGRARIRDVSASTINPELMRLRGRSMLVLVPIANPNSAEPLITLAKSLVPRGFGRILLQNVVVAGKDWNPNQDDAPLRRSQEVMRKLLAISAEQKVPAETLTSIAEKPMVEIARVASLHQCHSIVMGLSDLSDQRNIKRMERLLAVLDIDVVILRAPVEWTIGQAINVLIPVAGRGGHENLLSRLVGSLQRDFQCQFTFVTIVPPKSSAAAKKRAERNLSQLAGDLLLKHVTVQIVEHADAAEALGQVADQHDLLLLGATRTEKSDRVLGQFTQEVASITACPLVVLSSREL